METTMETGAGAGTIATVEWIADAALRYPWWVLVGIVSGVGFWLGWKQAEERWRHERELETERMRARLAVERDWLAAALRAAEDEEAASFVRLARALGLDKPPNGGERSSNPRVSIGGKSRTRGKCHVPDVGVEAPKVPAPGPSGSVGDAGQRDGGADGGNASTSAKTN